MTSLLEQFNEWGEPIEEIVHNGHDDQSVFAKTLEDQLEHHLKLLNKICKNHGVKVDADKIFTPILQDMSQQAVVHYDDKEVCKDVKIKYYVDADGREWPYLMREAITDQFRAAFKRW